MDTNRPQNCTTIITGLIFAACASQSALAQINSPDFDGDTRADLAIPVIGESVGGLDTAGAVNILYGHGVALTVSGDQLFHQNSSGIGNSSESGDSFGFVLAYGDFDGKGSPIWRSAFRLKISPARATRARSR